MSSEITFFVTMQFMQKTLRLSLAGAVWGMVVGCSLSNSIIPDRRPDYRESKVEDPLEIPPDLTTSTIDDGLIVPEINPTGSASFSDYTSERGGRVQGAVLTEPILQEPAGIRLERDGNRRWLLVEQNPEKLWPRVRDFWTSNGLVLRRADPRIGVMETEWAENRADIADGPIRSVLSKIAGFAYSSPTRDKFRVRLERGPEGTDVFLTHYGLEAVTVGGAGNDKSQDAIWEPRPRDPELEAEMLNRLMVFLGASERRAAAELANTDEPQAPRTQLTDYEGGQKALVINESYARAWRLVGLALDGSNFVVEDQNRAQGLYVVEYSDPLGEQGEEGFLSKLAFWRGKTPPPEGVRYQVRLAGRGSQTLVVVQNAAGEPDSSSTAELILNSLMEVIQ